jgi:hypothetical protein
MGNNDRNDPPMARDSIARRRPWRLLILSAAALAVVMLLLSFFFRDWLMSRWRGEDDQVNRFPPGALRDYVPEDSDAVLAINVQALRESPVGRRLTPSLQQLIRQGGRRLRWIDLLGFNPLDDVDSLQISFAPASGGEPLWLARGRLERSRIQMGPDKIQEATLDHFRVWECTDRRAKRTTLLAPVGDTLVVSESPGRVLAALKQARYPQPITVQDATLRELLAKVDRRQTLWLAASMKRLRSLTEIEDPLLKMVLRPLRMHADSAHGGITCAEDVQVDFHFHAATVEGAERLEAELQSLCEAAPGAALTLQLMGANKELLPLLKLLGSGKTRRDGNEVHLHCRLAADQLGS